MSPDERHMYEDIDVASYYLARAQRSAAHLGRSLILGIRHDGSITFRTEKWDSPVLAPGYRKVLSTAAQAAHPKEGTAR